MCSYPTYVMAFISISIERPRVFFFFFFFSFAYTTSPAAVMTLVVFFRSSKPPQSLRPRVPSTTISYCNTTIRSICHCRSPATTTTTAATTTTTTTIINIIIGNINITNKKRNILLPVQSPSSQLSSPLSVVAAEV